MTNASTALAKAPSVATAREGFDEKSIQTTGETAQSALVAQATAEVQARFIVAQRRPRDDDRVRQRLLAACRRPIFAEKAFYSVERGNKPGRLTGRPGRVEGLSARFAEEAFRLSGNLESTSHVLYEDDYRRTVRVTVTDLETNATRSADFVMSKTVERRSVKDGQVILSSRTNSQGDKVHIVQASDDELFQKQNNLTSKTSRTLVNALIPPDTREECEQAIVNTWKDEDAKDPDASRKRLLDAFAQLGVPADELKEYMGHDGAHMTADERLTLGGLRVAIQDGEVTWAQALAERREQRGAPGEGKPKGPSATNEKIAARAAELKKREAAKKSSPAAPAQATPSPVSATARAPAEGARASAEDEADAPPPDDVITVGDSRERQPGED